MSKVSITKAKLDYLANRISAKSGESLPLTLDEMADAVDDIQTGGTPNLQAKTYTVDSAGTETITADSGYDGLSSVSVSVPSADFDTYFRGTYGTEGNQRIWTLEGGIDVSSTGLMVDGVIAVVDTDYNAVPSNTSVTPTESAQTIGGANYMMEGAVTVNAIPSNYVGSGITQRSSTDITASGAMLTVPAGYYQSQATKSVTTMTLPTSAASSATSGYTSKATIGRSTSNQYINIPPGYNYSGGYYTISAVANGSATAPASISGTSATVSTGTNTLTLSKTVSVTPTVTAGYVSSGTAGNSAVSLTASVTTQAAQTIYPSTSDQTIASGRYLTGAQTIKAVSQTNLSADNIKSGTTITISNGNGNIWSVLGTYTGGGTVNIDTKTVTASTSNYPVSIEFTSMKGQPKAFFLRSTSQISSSGSTTYYYIMDMVYDGNQNNFCNGNVFRIGSTRRIDPITTATSQGITTGYTWSYTGTTLTITSSAASRSASPGAFNNGYQLVYIY